MNLISLRSIRVAVLLAVTVVFALPSLVGRRIKAATCVMNPVVMNNSDSGAGSLRQAILDACDGSTITFANTVASAITLASELAVDKNLTIQGPGAGALTISGNNTVRVFNLGSVDPAINVTIFGLTVAEGGGLTIGGGILNSSSGTVTVTQSTFSGNNANGNSGGGIISNGAGTLSVTNCIFSGNTVIGGDGGGIFNLSTGTLNVSGCTFSGNNTTSGFSGIGGGPGGGISNRGTGMMTVTNSTFTGNNVTNGFGGGIANSGTATVINSTFIGNTTNGGFGGGIFMFSNGRVTVANCTFSGNLTTVGNGGGIVNPGGQASVRNTIIALNNPDVFGGFASQGHNLIGIGDGSTGFTNGVNGDQVGSSALHLDPKLGSLQDNGGPTLTMALLPGSPAIDAGDDSVLGAPLFLTTDQRGPGFSRKAGPHVDIGAFEVQFDTCLKDSSTGNVFLFNSSTGQYKFTRCSDGFMISGTGVVRLVNGILTLTDSKPDRRISAGLNTGQRTGSATIYIMIAPGVWQSFRINSINPAAVCSC